MFAAACATAYEFTRPIIVLTRHFDGTCNASMGAFVVINEEDWFVTALHIPDAIKAATLSNQNYTSLEQQRQAIKNDAKLSPGAVQRELKKVPMYASLNRGLVVNRERCNFHYLTTET